MPAITKGIWLTNKHDTDNDLAISELISHTYVNLTKYGLSIFFSLKTCGIWVHEHNEKQFPFKFHAYRCCPFSEHLSLSLDIPEQERSSV